MTAGAGEYSRHSEIDKSKKCIEICEVKEFAKESLCYTILG